MRSLFVLLAVAACSGCASAQNALGPFTLRTDIVFSLCANGDCKQVARQIYDSSLEGIECDEAVLPDGDEFWCEDGDCSEESE